jgi:hypothetical protein
VNTSSRINFTRPRLQSRTRARGAESMQAWGQGQIHGYQQTPPWPQQQHPWVEQNNVAWNKEASSRRAARGRTPSPPTRAPATSAFSGIRSPSPATAHSDRSPFRPPSGARHPSPSPMARAGREQLADSQGYHRAGYTSPVPQHASPPLRGASPASRSVSQYPQARSNRASPRAGQEGERPRLAVMPSQAAAAASAAASTTYRPQAASAHDQLKQYKIQVQDLKHAIQAHASNMGVDVSSIMDRCAVESNASSNDNLLLQVRSPPLIDNRHCRYSRVCPDSLQSYLDGHLLN